MDTKLAQVVMLPTKEKNWSKKRIRKCINENIYVPLGKLEIDTIGHKLPNHMINTLDYWEPQHLYFISTDTNEEIKGDEYYLGNVEGFSTEWQLYVRGKGNVNGKTPKKIIASTDPALGLPAIPLTWIRDVYVPSNGSIKEVRLETYRHVENVEVVNGVAPVYSDRLRLINNEVIITDEPIISEYIMQRLKDIKIKFQQKLDAKTDSLKVDQELEEAANQAYKRGEGMGIAVAMIAKAEFQLGANWKAEQSANDAIEFAEWTHKNLWTPINDDGLWYNKNKVYQYKTECLTTKELYELWQQSKNK